MLIVGGTFDKNGGKPSHFISLMQKFFNCKVINGGDLKSIYSFHPQGTDVLLWMPNIDNSEDKILERLKVMNPHMLLISSKRVIEQQYTDYELVNRAIKAKANLSIIILIPSCFRKSSINIASCTALRQTVICSLSSGNRLSNVSILQSNCSLSICLECLGIWLCRCRLVRLGRL